MFAAGFIFLIGSVGAVTLGQLDASALAAWLSMAYSAGAIGCTVAALIIRGER